MDLILQVEEVVTPDRATELSASKMILFQRQGLPYKLGTSKTGPVVLNNLGPTLCVLPTT